MGIAYSAGPELSGNQLSNSVRDAKEIQGEVDELVRGRPVCIDKVQPHDMQVTSLSLSSLDLCPDYC